MYDLIKTKSHEQPNNNVAPLNQNLNEVVTMFRERLVIRYLKDSNIVLAKGRSTSLEVLPVYFNLIEKVKAHFECSNKLVCYFHYSLINATTTKLLFNLFKVMQEAQNNGNDVTLFWVVDEGNEDLLAVGLDLKVFTEFNFIITQP